MQQQSHSVGTGDFEKTIGSDARCDVSVCLPGIATRHAVMKRIGDRLFIKDLKSQSGVFLNGQRLRAKVWAELAQTDQISLGPHAVSLHHDLFRARPRLSVESTALTLRSGDGVALCDGAYVTARPGTVTAVMGPSGSGKSILLNLLNGYVPPTVGHVCLREQIPNGRTLDIHRNTEAVRSFLGYVPQAEVMIPELTVQASLDCRLKLRFPDMTASTRDKIVRHTCRSLGFDGERLERFLSTRIGSPETRGTKVLSGGERRRANIAHELIMQPLALILDEPTSGLSSVDSDQIVELLHQLACTSQITVITTIHQPSRDAFAKFDDLLVMTYIGKIIYYGPASRATEYFRQVTGRDCGQRNPAEYVLEVLKDSVVRQQMADRWVHAHSRPSYAPLPMSLPHQSAVSVSPAGVTKRHWAGVPVLCRCSAGWMREWATLLNRSLRVFLSDRANLWLGLGQVPLIALMVFLAFKGVSRDHSEYDLFAKRVYHFGILKASFESERRSVPAEQLWREAGEAAKADRLRISEFSARQRAAVLFVIVVAGVWFGVMIGCREIVREQHVVQREARSCMRIGPYVLSKAALLAAWLAVQTALLSVLIAPGMLGIGWPGGVRLWLVLWLTSVAAASLGLCVSGLARSDRVALAAVPLLMIPQLLFSGILRPEALSTRQTRWPQILGLLTVQRWGFAAALETDEYARDGVLAQTVGGQDEDKYAVINLIRFREQGLAACFFPRSGIDRPSLLPLAVLFSGMAALLGATWFVLQRRHRGQKQRQ